MRYVCHSVACQMEINCECGSECCTGYKVVPYVIDLDKATKYNQQEELELVLHHICPDCGGWVEC